MYESSNLQISEHVRSAHTAGWQKLCEPGAFWSANDRVRLILESRAALICRTCQAKKQSLSPNAIHAEHESVSGLPSSVVDMVHRLRTDPGRLTKTAYESFRQHYSIEEYVELVSVINTALVIDTMHVAVGAELPQPSAHAGEPTGQPTIQTVEDGAWVPIALPDPELNELGIPKSANIVRSMGAVPSAVMLFFGVFRAHYLISPLPIAMERKHAELVAAKVSALNQCFY